MVMEASPSPQSVGREFVRQYYTLLNKAPAHLHRFYNNYSMFVHGGVEAVGREAPPVVGQKQIHHRIQQLNFRDCHAKISQVDSQATLGNGVVVQVSGELSNGGAPMRRFTQTFVLAAQSPKKYYVHNDIFRYQDVVFSDSEGSGSGRSEGEEEEPTPYFAGGFPPPPPPPTVDSAPVTSQPASQQAAAAQHLNGHPAAAVVVSTSAVVAEDATRQLVAAMQGASLRAVDVEPEPEPEVEEDEDEEEPSPPQQHQPAVVSPPEPKTYANLLKHAVGGPAPGGAAPCGPGPAAPPPRAEPPPDRSRPPRVDRDRERDRDRDYHNTSNESGAAPAGGGGGGGRRYSDAQQVFVGNVPHSCSETALRALVSRFGPVADLRLHSKPNTGGGRGHPNYGFITFELAAGALACLRAQPLFYPAEGAPDAVKLNIEEKKARRDHPATRRRPLSGARYRPAPPAGGSAGNRR